MEVAQMAEKNMTNTAKPTTIRNVIASWTYTTHLRSAFIMMLWEHPLIGNQIELDAKMKLSLFCLMDNQPSK